MCDKAQKERRFHRIRWTVGSLIFVLFFMGHAYGEARPIVRYDGARLLKIQQGKALARVDLQVTNPDKKEIPVEYGRADLRLGHHPIGYGTVAPTSLPALAEKKIAIPVVLSLSVLGGVLGDLFTQTLLPWSAQGYVQVSGSRVPEPA